MSKTIQNQYMDEPFELVCSIPEDYQYTSQPVTEPEYVTKSIKVSRYALDLISSYQDFEKTIGQKSKSLAQELSLLIDVGITSLIEETVKERFGEPYHTEEEQSAAKELKNCLDCARAEEELRMRQKESSAILSKREQYKQKHGAYPERIKINGMTIRFKTVRKGEQP